MQKKIFSCLCLLNWKTTWLKQQRPDYYLYLQICPPGSQFESLSILKTWHNTGTVSLRPAAVRHGPDRSLCLQDRDKLGTKLNTEPSKSQSSAAAPDAPVVVNTVRGKIMMMFNHINKATAIRRGSVCFERINTTAKNPTVIPYYAVKLFLYVIVQWKITLDMSSNSSECLYVTRQYCCPPYKKMGLCRKRWRTIAPEQ